MTISSLRTPERAGSCGRSIRDVVPAMREMFKNPHAYGQLEVMAKRFEEWQERNAPGHIAAMTQMMSRPRTTSAKS